MRYPGSAGCAAHYHDQVGHRRQPRQPFEYAVISSLTSLIERRSDRLQGLAGLDTVSAITGRNVMANAPSNGMRCPASGLARDLMVELPADVRVRFTRAGAFSTHA